VIGRYSNEPRVISSVEFYDSEEEKVVSVSSRAKITGADEYELEENEELIGVYGVMNEHMERLSSFGFIVKVKKSD